MKILPGLSIAIMANGLETLRACQSAYILLLRHGDKIADVQAVQATLCKLRDAIAEATLQDAEDVQNAYEIERLWMARPQSLLNTENTDGANPPTPTGEK